MISLPLYKVGAVFAGYWDASKGALPPAPSQDTFWIVSKEGTMDAVFYEAGTSLSYFDGRFWKQPGVRIDFAFIANAPDTATRWASWDETENKPVGDTLPNTLIIRDDNGDAEARLWKSYYPSQSVIPEDSSISFRVNSDDDTYIRFASKEALVQYLGTVLNTKKVDGKTVDEIRGISREGLVPDTLTVNGKRLNANINLTSADVGLNNLPNYPATNSFRGTSTSLLATQKAAYDASFAPNLDPERKRKVIVEQREPTSADGEDGQIWLVY